MIAFIFFDNRDGSDDVVAEVARNANGAKTK
jgi:hypothetical protein